MIKKEPKLTGNKHIDSIIIDTLSYKEQLELAKNNKTNPEILTILINSKYKNIQDYVFTNPNTPTEVIAKRILLINRPLFA